MADYPGVIPYSETVALLALDQHTRGLSPEERTVRGSLVQGLNESDIALLDDPLSAVDSHVAKHILQNCLLHGPLAQKTRIRTSPSVL